MGSAGYLRTSQIEQFVVPGPKNGGAIVTVKRKQIEEGWLGDRKQMKNSYSDIENCKRMEVIDIIFIYASERKWLRKMTKRHVRPVLKLFTFYVCFS